MATGFSCSQPCSGINSSSPATLQHTIVYFWKSKFQLCRNFHFVARTTYHAIRPRSTISPRTNCSEMMSPMYLITRSIHEKSSASNQPQKRRSTYRTDVYAWNHHNSRKNLGVFNMKIKNSSLYLMKTYIAHFCRYISDWYRYSSLQCRNAQSLKSDVRPILQ